MNHLVLHHDWFGPNNVQRVRYAGIKLDIHCCRDRILFLFGPTKLWFLSYSYTFSLVAHQHHLLLLEVICIQQLAFLVIYELA